MPNDRIKDAPVTMCRRASPFPPCRPSLLAPLQVDPDRWLESLHGRAFARTVRSDGTVTVDDLRYYVKQERAGQVINLVVHAPDQVFHLFQGATQIKRLPIKGLSGKVVSFEEYVWLIRKAGPFRQASISVHVPGPSSSQLMGLREHHSHLPGSSLHHERLVVQPPVALFPQKARFLCRRHVLMPAVSLFIFFLWCFHHVITR
jgi:hypothetical protein